MLVVSSSELEGIFHRRNEEYINRIAEERQNGSLREWMQSEFGVGQRKRLEKEREQAKERMKEETKVSAERAEAEGRALFREISMVLVLRRCGKLDSGLSMNIEGIGEFFLK